MWGLASLDENYIFRLPWWWGMRNGTFHVGKNPVTKSIYILLGLNRSPDHIKLQSCIA